MFYFQIFTTPEKPINAIAKRPAVIRAIGVPFIPFGIFTKLICSRKPAKRVSAKAKTDSCGKCINHTGQQIIIFLNYKDGNTKNTTVSCDQRQNTPSA